MTHQRQSGIRLRCHRWACPTSDTEAGRKPYNPGSEEGDFSLKQRACPKSTKNTVPCWACGGGEDPPPPGRKSFPTRRRHGTGLSGRRAGHPAGRCTVDSLHRGRGPIEASCFAGLVRRSRDLTGDRGNPKNLYPRRDCAFRGRKHTAEPTLTTERWFLSVCVRFVASLRPVMRYVKEVF